MAAQDERIESLRADVLEIMGLVRQSLEESVRSLDDRDVDLANEVLKRERQVNELETRVDNACLEMLGEGVEGRRLRVIAATFKLITDVERIGDYSVAIAEVTLAVANKPVTTTSLDLTKMAGRALHMLDSCIAAYMEKSSIDMDGIFREDGEIDRLYEEVFISSISSVLGEPKLITNVMYMTVAARALERIGDHITNIAEDISYMETGRLVRRDEAVYVPAFP
ncbi:phosphate signaling complex protein PhoU [Methanocella conradii]|uniref:phosphate signaling complex protein PhoU n=1 Tax=Methanocella conradii TaxID=1175444 RepID=UPI0024B3AD12|nr:phosphate signaling complex protein PhoU [Methanocella conradii]MDI6897247.1 phosphate signaling complex protein PhoU [Methanocella conradii]